MILTCPACGTQYVVKDGAIPPQGRQVRCASCRHSWHQDPEPTAETEAGDVSDETGAPASTWSEEAIDEAAASTPIEAEDRPMPEAVPPDPVAPPVEGLVEPPMAAPIPPYDEGPAAAEPTAPVHEPVDPLATLAEDDDFSPFAEREPVDRERRSPLLTALLALLLIVAAAAAFWFLAPPEWKQRVGLAGIGETPLQLMATHYDRQALASGNELLQVSGRVINPTDESQPVPPIHAQLKSSSGKLIYSWTIAPPARTLPPGASASFNSAEVNVPAGGDELTITLGSPRA